jgi:L-aminopeptidase/D-esterase-like protein
MKRLPLKGENYRLPMAAQDDLKVNTSILGPVLQFDWPLIEIGVGSYEEGPTGLTIFRFRKSVLGALDVRGGAPGTVNIDSVRLGSEEPTVDAVVFAGGSAYGEEAITAVATGLKDDGAFSGDWDDVAGVPGAILYDFLNHRLNEIYPDKRLAQAALHALRPGVFPLGAQGAGRMAMQGGFFGWPAHSGQGGAFRQIHDIKIAAFAVINAVGTITDRDGNVVKDGRGLARSHRLKISELLARIPEARALDCKLSDTSSAGGRHTTLSLVVTNKQLSHAELQRLAVQVHSSMARAIQPFSTMNDGDTLFALSTNEATTAGLTLPDLAAIAGEIMWDAILASVPEEPIFEPPSQPILLSEKELTQFHGSYRFGPNAVLKITVEEDRLVADPHMKAFFDLRPQERSILLPISQSEFYIESPYHTRLSFRRDTSGQVTAALINPGNWQQTGVRLIAN